MVGNEKKPITIVAGFGRCGSSLVMQMLAASGMPTPHSSFPAYEITPGTPIVMGELYGGAVKILDPHLHRPPMGPEYRWIWLDRDPVEQAKSAAKFWKATMVEGTQGLPGLSDFHEFTGDQIAKLAEAFKRDRPRANGVMLEYTQSSGILKLKFEDILADPEITAIRLAKFCSGDVNVGPEGPLGPVWDIRAMAAAVRPRGPECLPYLLELEQIEEAQ